MRDQPRDQQMLHDMLNPPAEKPQAAGAPRRDAAPSAAPARTAYREVYEDVERPRRRPHKRLDTFDRARLWLGAAVGWVTSTILTFLTVQPQAVDFWLTFGIAIVVQILLSFGEILLIRGRWYMKPIGLIPLLLDGWFNMEGADRVLVNLDIPTSVASVTSPVFWMGLIIGSLFAIYPEILVSEARSR